MRQIVILDCPLGDGKQVINGFFWFPISTVSARVPRPQFVSAGVVLDAPHALTTAEQAALEDGSVREERFSITFASSTTGTDMQNELARQWAARKAAIDAEPAVRRFFGRSWDGTNWVA